MSASVGFGLRSSISSAATSSPGVQKPHWTAPAVDERLLHRGEFGALTGLRVLPLGGPLLGFLKGRTAGTGGTPPVLGALLGEVRQPLDGDDLPALHLTGGDQTRTHRQAVEPDGAGPALPLLAGVLRTRQTEPLPQHVQQALALPDVVGFLRTAVDREMNAHYATLPF